MLLGIVLVSWLPANFKSDRPVRPPMHVGMAPRKELTERVKVVSDVMVQTVEGMVPPSKSFERSNVRSAVSAAMPEGIEPVSESPLRLIPVTNPLAQVTPLQVDDDPAHTGVVGAPPAQAQ